MINILGKAKLSCDNNPIIKIYFQPMSNFGILSPFGNSPCCIGARKTPCCKQAGHSPYPRAGHYSRRGRPIDKAPPKWSIKSGPLRYFIYPICCILSIIDMEDRRFQYSLKAFIRGIGHVQTPGRPKLAYWVPGIVGILVWGRLRRPFLYIPICLRVREAKTMRFSLDPLKNPTQVLSFVTDRLRGCPCCSCNRKRVSRKQEDDFIS